MDDKLIKAGLVGIDLEVIENRDLDKPNKKCGKVRVGVPEELKERTLGLVKVDDDVCEYLSSRFQMLFREGKYKFDRCQLARTVLGGDETLKVWSVLDGDEKIYYVPLEVETKKVVLLECDEDMYRRLSGEFERMDVPVGFEVKSEMLRGVEFRSGKKKEVLPFVMSSGEVALKKNGVEMMRVAVRCGTTEGERGNNEDYLVVKPFGVRYLEDGREVVEDCLLVGVFDGMGGHADGEKASLAAVTGMTNYVEELNGAEAFANRDEMLLAVANCTWAAMVGGVSRECEVGESGTTATYAIIAADGKYILPHVGDSRAYQLGGARLTEDNSMVWDAFSRGDLTEDQLADSPYKNVLLDVITGETGDGKGEFKIGHQGILKLGEGLTFVTDGVWEGEGDFVGRGLERNPASLESLRKVAVEYDPHNKKGDNCTVVEIEIERRAKL